MGKQIRKKKHAVNKIKVSDPVTACYKRCPDGDCVKSTVPSMKH